MVSLETYTLIQNIVGGIFLGDQIIGIILLLTSRILGKRIEKGKTDISKENISKILFNISAVLIGLSFLCFLFLYINKNIYDFSNAHLYLYI